MSSCAIWAPSDLESPSPYSPTRVSINCMYWTGESAPGMGSLARYPPNRSKANFACRGKTGILWSARITWPGRSAIRRPGSWRAAWRRPTRTGISRRPQHVDPAAYVKDGKFLKARDVILRDLAKKGVTPEKQIVLILRQRRGGVAELHGSEGTRVQKCLSCT